MSNRPRQKKTVSKAGRGGGTEGLVERRDGALTVGGVPLAPERSRRVREGDRVAFTVEAAPAGNGVRARVQEVLEYSPQPLIGLLDWRARHPHVESLSPEYRGRIALTEPPAVGTHGDAVAVRVLGEDRRGYVGLVQALVSADRGAAHAAETLLASHRVPREWPQAALNAAERLPASVAPRRHAGRRQLLDLPLVTIDGETARDFDDAVFAERERGGWRLVVAIADVAHYVKAGSVLDECARERGNSVYLPDRVVPMLPEALSNHLCSLRPDEARLAMVCEMRVSAGGNVTRYEFYEAVIRSWQRLTYTRVQEFLDSGALDVQPEVTRSLSALADAYRALRAARDARGALDFDSHEALLELTGDGGVRAIHPVQRLDAHRLIEEAMIAANVAAARFLERSGVGALYRVHEPPQGDKAEQVRQALGFAGVRLPRGDVSPGAVADALTQLADRPDRWIFELLVLRSLTQAVYSPENKGHFGLALPRYMHFTSPIRRYADLVVHRAIKSVLKGNGKGAGTPDWLVACGLHVSMTERRAEAVAWGVDGWLKCEYVADRIGETFDGVIMGVAEFGVFVELSGFYVQGLLHVSELGGDYFQLQGYGLSLVGERTGRRFGLGDRVTVRLVDAQPALGRLDLVLADRGGGGQRRAARGRDRGGDRGRATGRRHPGRRRRGKRR